MYGREAGDVNLGVISRLVTSRRMAEGVSAQIHSASHINMVWNLLVVVLFLFFGQHVGCTTDEISWASVKDFEEEHVALIEDFAQAVQQRINIAESNPTNWTCRCAYHECGDFFEGHGSCYHLDAPLTESHCPRDQVHCSPTLVTGLIWILHTWPGDSTRSFGISYCVPVCVKCAVLDVGQIVLFTSVFTLFHM